MPHPENCNCHNCQAWFANMQAYISRGRCGCGWPIDSHRMTTKGEVVECPKGKVAS